MSKKILNNPSECVEEMLEGAEISQRGVKRLEGWNVLVREDIDFVKANRVAIISGGGSGHEPSHGGWVGEGMLSAAVAGGVFASPSTNAVLAAILTVTGPKGCLVIIKNYTGDRLNFGLAAEQAKARGLKVEVVVVGDDCALPNRGKGIAGRRGVAGTVFVHKVAGAAAELGLSLEEVKQVAEKASKSIATIGVATTVCTLPGKERNERLGENECELGLGIHGEPGVVKQNMESCDTLVNKTLAYIFKQEEGWKYLNVANGDKVALMVNNLGSTTPMELSVVARRAFGSLTNQYKVKVERLLAGTFMSSLDMAGFSLTVFVLDEQLLQYLDAPTKAHAWPNTIATPKISSPFPCPDLSSKQISSSTCPKISEKDAELFKNCVKTACESVKEIHEQLTEWDQKVGDGDCGDTLASGADLLLNSLSSFDFTKPDAAFSSIAAIIERMGGTSGAIYTILFVSIAGFFSNFAHSRDLNLNDWVEAFETGVNSVSRYGGATKGDRTMLDALIPAVEALKESLAKGESFNLLLSSVSNAATKGANETKSLKAHAGRSSYVPEELLKTVPDPGAMAVAQWISAVTKLLSSQ